MISFSIPGRIELSATVQIRLEYQPSGGLSVSPVGSSCLQLSRRLPWLTRSAGLSVSPVGSSCLQLNISSGLGIQNKLSVSPVGSSCLQPCNGWGMAPLSSFFQYPRSDRVVCNDEVGGPGSTCTFTFSIPGRIELSATQSGRVQPFYVVQLSVSPVGSSCLQRQKEVLWRAGLLPFSIPGRIELSATNY